MGFLESLRDKELRGLYRARKLVESADLLIEKGHVQEALAEFETVKELVSREGIKESPHSKDYADLLIVLSGVMLKAKSYDDALATADKALTLNPSNPSAMSARARAFAVKGSPAEAITQMDRAIELKGNDKKLLFDKAKVLEQSGDKEQAAAVLKKVVEMDPSDIETYDALIALDDQKRWTMAKAEALLRSKRYDDSLKALDDVLSHDPKNLDVMLVKAKILMEERCFDEASAIYDMVLDIEPTSFSANIGKAQVLRSAGELEASVKFYKEALRADVERKETWNEVGPLLEQLKRFEEAEMVYTHALKLDPDYLSALEGHYRTLQALERWPEMIDAASLVLAQKPELAVHKSKITALVKTQRFKEGLEAVNAALLQFPKEPELVSRKRDISAALGMGDETVKYCEEILADKPHDPETMYDLGVAYCRALRFHESRKMLEKWPSRPMRTRRRSSWP